jgi:hypothetical protein
LPFSIGRAPTALAPEIPKDELISIIGRGVRPRRNNGLGLAGEKVSNLEDI